MKIVLKKSEEMGLEEKRLPIFLSLLRAGFNFLKPFLKTACLTCLKNP